MTPDSDHSSRLSMLPKGHFWVSLLGCGLKTKSIPTIRPPVIAKERSLIENLDFEERFLKLTEEIFDAFGNDNKKLWLRQLKRRDELLNAVKAHDDDASFHHVFLIDRLDES